MNKRKLIALVGGLVVLGIGAITGIDVNGLLGGGQPSQLSDNRSGGNTRVTPSRSGSETFDYYVLVLSWSPTFCIEKNDNNSRQCNGSRDFGFVVHGLWPQFESGYPEFCDVSARVEDRIVDQMLPIMPAKGLIYHQWKKHGTCSGQRPREYFDTVQAAYRSIEIPEALKKLSKPIEIDPRVIEDAFIDANDDINADEIVVNCRKNRLREVKICLTPGLEPRACGKDVHRECRDQSVRMPPIR